MVVILFWALKSSTDNDWVSEFFQKKTTNDELKKSSDFRRRR